MKKHSLLVFLIAFAVFSCTSNTKEKQEAKVYEANWQSLANHNEAPDWFQDAKLGIYFHWGVYSVPAFGNEWYPRWMHFEDRKEYQHHVENYGHPSDFGYHDFVPMFTAEHFNAEEWAELFKKAGARFAGPVAEHHDGFSMWDSEVNPWNAKDKGPGVDITGELKTALEKRDIKLITTFHHAKHLQRYWDTREEEINNLTVESGQRFYNSHYPLFPDMPTLDRESERKHLYGNIPEEEWLEKVWFGKLKEVIHKYEPDIIWFDSWLDEIPEAYRQKFCAYYLNEAQKWDKEVVIVRKQDDLPLTLSIDDLEKSRKNELTPEVWMTDETISKGSWCYTEGLEIKEGIDVLHVLIDIVSKNGILLLNISPKADGTIPADQRQVLLTMGTWLEEFGDCIYGSRPWITYGEGPVREPEGHFDNRFEFLKIKYSYEDVRYTQKDDRIFAIVLGKPEPGQEFHFSAFSNATDLEIKEIRLLGSEEKVSWKMEPNGLHLSTGFAFPNSLANVFEISLR